LNFSGYHPKTHIQLNIPTFKSSKVIEIELDTIQIYEKSITLINLEKVLT